MTKVTSTKSISFPKLGWGITAGTVRELPENKEAQERIMQEPEITVFTGKVEPIKSNQSQDEK